MVDGPPPIDNRAMLHHYIQEVSHIEECTSTNGRCTASPPLDHRPVPWDPTNTIKKKLTYLKG